jgi:hypothetical protein
LIRSSITMLSFFFRESTNMAHSFAKQAGSFPALGAAQCDSDLEPYPLHCKPWNG